MSRQRSESYLSVICMDDLPRSPELGSAIGRWLDTGHLTRRPVDVPSLPLKYNKIRLARALEQEHGVA